ncbi:MAG: hypothetical protein RLZZ338_1294 [Cyanobacteriota bacterium]
MCNDQSSVTAYYKLVNSVLDRWVAAIVLLILSPMGLIVFSQKPPSKDGHIFTCYKFRTMTNDRDSDGNLLSDAQYLTGFGKFLRQKSLDDIIQLWSVLKGDMSFVGLRTLLIEYLPYYWERESKRHSVLP